MTATPGRPDPVWTPSPWPYDNDTLYAPVTGISILVCLSYRFAAAARRAGRTPVWKEDGRVDPVDYDGHGVGREGASYHYQLVRVPFLRTADPRGVAYALDANVTGAGEMSWLLAQLPMVRAHGVAYNVEAGHLHLDCGPFVNDGAGWGRRDWVGAPTNGLLIEDGIHGPKVTRAWQLFLRTTGRYRGALDGSWGPATEAAGKAYLHTRYTSRQALSWFLETDGAPFGSPVLTARFQQQLNLWTVGLGRLSM